MEQSHSQFDICMGRQLGPWRCPTSSSCILVRCSLSCPQPFRMAMVAQMRQGHARMATAHKSQPRQAARVIRCRNAVEPLAVGWDMPHEQVIKTGIVNTFDAVNFDELLSVAGPGRLVVVDVFTTWCGPCKMIAPKVEELAAQYGDKVVMAKIDCTNIPENKKWAMTNAVKALPTFIAFKDSVRVDSMTGAKISALEEMIEKNK